MKLNRKIQAIIWDYDGTLVDTRFKNFNVTKMIIRDITGSDPNKFPVLQNVEKYELANYISKNWREMYQREFGLNEDQIDCAGKLWTPYQLKDRTPVPFINGIPKVIQALKTFSQGIVSQNSKNGIIQQLRNNHLTEFFSCIIGYEEVSLSKQKPEPDGLLLCIEELTSSTSGYIFYIGDHETDMQCAQKASQRIENSKPDLTIFTIGVFHGLVTDDSSWSFKPDFITKKPEDILKVIHKK